VLGAAGVLFLLAPPVTSVAQRAAPAAQIAAPGTQRGAPADGPTTGQIPGADWARIADPTTSGFCQAGLDRATEHVATMATTGVMAVVDGRVLWSAGDLEHVSYVASVRKSILAMLYGNYVASGHIDLDATLGDLGIDDREGLLPAEKQATVADLLAARSGVYHPASNAACAGCGSTAGDPPGPRGTVPPGTHFLYNNWDFNALGTIFEQQTGLDVYDAFQKDLAEPLGLQDFDRASHRPRRGNSNSVHGAYHFNLSARDLARIGYLMLREGEWGGRQLVPRDWTRRIVSVVTPVAEMNPESYRRGPFGYGYLWWLWDGPHAEGAYRGAYTGIGAVGQFVTVLPEVGMVIAHKTRTGGESVGRPQYLELVDRLVNARCAP
jgi:CubicO group peptidase (beta-lactamase class C family)